MILNAFTTIGDSRGGGEVGTLQQAKALRIYKANVAFFSFIFASKILNFSFFFTTNALYAVCIMLADSCYVFTD